MIEFELNGQPVVFNGASDTPLLWAIRDHFKLKGSKFGCGAGLCGACTMHVDSTAMRTCILPVAAVAGKRITTIEGLSGDGLHPLQAAWVEHNVPHSAATVKVARSCPLRRFSHLTHGRQPTT